MSGECRFSWEVRLLPGEDMRTILDPFERLSRQIEAEMRAIGPKVSIATVETSSVPAFAPVAGNAAIALAHRPTDARAAAVVSYASEAGQFQPAGFPTVICGPGSLEQAHQAAEFVRTEASRVGKEGVR